MGNRAGVFLTSLRSSGSLLALIQRGLFGQPSPAGAFPFGASGAQGAIVLDTRELKKARAFLDAAAARAGAVARSYRGIAYRLSGGDVAFALVRRFAVIGSDAGIRAVIDTTLGGPSLARAPGYSTLLGFAPAKAIAHLYSNTSGAPAGPPSGLAGLLALFAGARQVNVSLVPSASSLALDVDTLTAGSPSTQPLPSFASESARALGELPGDSWFAVGLGDVGHMLAADVQGLRGLTSLAGGQGPTSPGTGLGVKPLLEGLIKPLSVLAEDTPEASRSFRSWMGSAGIFASGASLLELKAAVVIGSNDAARSRAAVGKLAARLRAMGGVVQSASVPGAEAAATMRLTGLPVALVIASGRAGGGKSKFVIGLGEPSVTAALTPSSPLASAPGASEAAAALGEGAQPSIILEVPTLLGMLEGIGLTEDPTISPFVPYLRSLTTVAGGAHPLDASVERFRLVLGLRPGG
ncbi:MAG: hypothetical protein E6G62_11860 [Actinobacteria bacterium]|nr:MAG: hypothetical protein E6G62_11860 [Actinomycetota bacterium]